MSIQVRTLRRKLHRLHSRFPEDARNFLSEQRITIVNQKPFSTKEPIVLRRSRAQNRIENISKILFVTLDKFAEVADHEALLDRGE